MSAYNYGPLASKALKLIAKYGKDVTLTFASSASPADGARPWRGPAAGTVTATPKGVVTSFEKDELDGEHVRSTDMKLLVAPGDAALAGHDIERATTCAVDGVEYGATNLGTVKPGDTAMLYVLRLRNE